MNIYCCHHLTRHVAWWKLLKFVWIALQPPSFTHIYAAASNGAFFSNKGSGGKSGRRCNLATEVQICYNKLFLGSHDTYHSKCLVDADDLTTRVCYNTTFCKRLHSPVCFRIGGAISLNEMNTVCRSRLVWCILKAAITAKIILGFVNKHL